MHSKSIKQSKLRVGGWGRGSKSLTETPNLNWTCSNCSKTLVFGNFQLLLLRTLWSTIQRKLVQQSEFHLCRWGRSKGWNKVDWWSQNSTDYSGYRLEFFLARISRIHIWPLLDFSLLGLFDVLIKICIFFANGNPSVAIEVMLHRVDAPTRSPVLVLSCFFLLMRVLSPIISPSMSFLSIRTERSLAMTRPEIFQPGQTDYKYPFEVLFFTCILFYPLFAFPNLSNDGFNLRYCFPQP